MKTLTGITQKLSEVLDNRKNDALFRSLQLNENLIDFCSNDYLSFARSKKIADKMRSSFDQHDYLNGSTGSRSISGNTALAEKLEKYIADFYGIEAALLFNSGYNANVGLFSCIAGKGDTIICDELIHASIIDGCRLSYANRFKFFHNNLNDLESKLRLAKGNIFVAVESVYSMDGDFAPLKQIADLCAAYHANLIVDEAHSTGIFGDSGKGLVNQYNIEDLVFARVHTFGKAMGCHGAVVIGSETLKSYLVNFARAFIFTTALPAHTLLNIQFAYEELAVPSFDNSSLHILIENFKKQFNAPENILLIDSASPIQCVVIGGNEKTRDAATQLQRMGFDVRAILSPSVPAGKERLRISLHLHNSTDEISGLNQSLTYILNK